MGSPFQTTRWSLVFRAAAPDGAGSAALQELCTRYWPAVYAFYRRSGREPAAAEDLTQGLFATLLERGDLAAVDPSRGRFRTWLCACARHHLADVVAAAGAARRGAGRVLLIEAAGEERRGEPVDREAGPEQAFVARWVTALVDRCVADVIAEWRSRGRERVGLVAAGCLGGEPPEPYAVLAERLGMSEGAFKVAVFRLREQVRDRLRAAVLDTLADPAELGDELNVLLGELQRRKIVLPL